MEIVIQALLIVYFFPSLTVQFHPTFIIIKQYTLALTWVNGLTLVIHPYLKIGLLTGIVAQLLFFLTRLKPETLVHVKNAVAQSIQPPSIDLHHPYIAVYVRRSDKVKYKEMCQAYTLKQYFDLFDWDARSANITRVYVNSEDEKVFK